MRKKIAQSIVVGAFIVIICLAGINWTLLEKYVDNTNYENRKLTSRPTLTIDNYGTFSKEYNEYYNDNIPFRNVLISLNSTIDYFIFKRSSSDSVIVGNDNWLFYCRKSDNDPIGCYQGTNLFSEEELESIAQNCIIQRDYLLQRGKEFVIFIAPNKERVYFEKMPEQYGPPAVNYRALQVVNYLKENTDIRVVYPYDELMAAKDSLNYNIYYKTDTHWNYIGGYVGAAALMRELGIDMPSLDAPEMEILNGENRAGDLAGMLNLKRQLKFADNEYQIKGYDYHDMQTLERDLTTVCSFSATDADPRKIYVYRDSFAEAMFPFIGSQFSESYFRHIFTYSYEDYVQQDPDIFVYEAVERNIGNLIWFSVETNQDE